MDDVERTKLDLTSLDQMIQELSRAAAVMQENQSQLRDEVIGEKLAQIVKDCGRIAAFYLFLSKWTFTESPEWFDHRLHWLDPATHHNDFWIASADNVIRVLPFGGRLLDLCSGDGFCDYWFYRYRAEIVAVEKDRATFDFAVKHHSHPKITHIQADALVYEPDGLFDVVLIRGAIEHFSKENQQKLFKKSLAALKPGGHFCGDTPAKHGAAKLLGSHEYEWADEREMREILGNVFKNVETWTLHSETRTTLFWTCQK